MKGVHQNGDGLWITRWHRWPGWHLGLIGDEEVVQVAGDEPGGGGLTAYNVDNLLTVERPGVPQEGFSAIVMVVMAIHKLPVQAPIGPYRIARHARHVQGGIADRPAGESTRALAHITLSIVPHPHRKKF